MIRKPHELKRNLFLLLIILVAIALLVSGGEAGETQNENQTIPPEGFVLNKIGDHYEPELHYNEFVNLPGTNIKFGAFKYIHYNKSESGGYDEIPVLGFLIDHKKFYYVKEPHIAASYGDAHYGKFKDYLLMDGFGYGASHNRRMYLFKYSKDTVQILDVICQAYYEDMPSIDFMTAYPSYIGKKYGYLGSNYPPIWTDIKDLDGDGRPEINLVIILGEPAFELYLELKNDQLHVNLNPDLYKPLFDKVVRENKNKSMPDSYYIYGYLSKQLDMQSIKTKLGLSKRSKDVLKLLKYADKWNKAFHDCEQKPKIKQLELNAR